MSTDPSHGWSTVLYDDGDCLSHDLRPDSNLWYAVAAGPVPKLVLAPDIAPGRNPCAPHSDVQSSRPRISRKRGRPVCKFGELGPGTTPFIPSPPNPGKTETQAAVQGLRSLTCADDTSPLLTPYFVENPVAARSTRMTAGDDFVENPIAARSVRRRKQSAPSRLLDPASVSSECDEIVVAFPPANQVNEREYHVVREHDDASFTDAEGPASNVEEKSFGHDTIERIQPRHAFELSEFDSEGRRLFTFAKSRISKSPQRLSWHVPTESSNIDSW